MKCPLCNLPSSDSFKHNQVKNRDFYHCRECDLIFADPAGHPNLEAEKARYETHNNSTGQAGYVQFLAQFMDPLLAVLKRLSWIEKEDLKILDFGSGPTEAFSELLSVRIGQTVQCYDPFFADDPALLQRTWDLVVSTEVCEHFRNPGLEFERIHSMLRPGGMMGFMTQFHEGTEKFKNWWYPRDPTHLVFYSEKTWAWIQLKWRLQPHYVRTPVAIMQKAFSDLP